MSVKELKNVAASVRQRLFNRSERDKRPFAELLQYYAMERFLYRLSQSSYADRFILKGALMFKVWEAEMQRATRDIDMLGSGTSNEENNIALQMREILSMDSLPDGILFDVLSIKTDIILEDAQYQGVKVSFQGKLDTARVIVHMDIGFGDIVYPQPEKIVFPALLDFPAPHLWCYSKESVIAEKFDAMVTRRMTNSRVKDFFDIWQLSRQFDFEKQKLIEAIRLTFAQRETSLSEKIIAFSEEFSVARQSQWVAFRKNLRLDYAPELFQEVVVAVGAFLSPVAMDVYSENVVPDKWEAPGPWKMNNI